MKSNIRKEQIKLLLSKQEKERFENIWGNLEEDCHISPKRQSEIIIEGFFQYAEQLLSSHVPHTHTKSQSQSAQRKEAIYSMIENIKEKGYMFIMQSYADLILSNECYSDVKMRSRSSYFQSLLQAEELFFIDISYYHDTTNRFPIVIIHRQSKWWPQLKDLCFNINGPIFKLTHDQITDAKLRDQIFARLKRRSKYRSKLDKAEKVMLNAFLFEIGELEEKPMYDNLDAHLKTVIKFRSELRFTEAQELIGANPENYMDDRERKKIEAIKKIEQLRGRA